MKTLLLAFVLATAAVALAQAAPPQQEARTPQDLAKVYQDESHCLTLADMRGDKDNHLSCFCRDAIADARYVYFTYLLPAKDRNLNGTYLRLRSAISETCGKDYDATRASEQERWQWDGPEVIRTYPSDDVIKRIRPEKREGKATGRWVPFTVQLVYRDTQGRVTRTENFASREFIPID